MWQQPNKPAAHKKRTSSLDFVIAANSSSVSCGAACRPRPNIMLKPDGAASCAPAAAPLHLLPAGTVDVTDLARVW